MSLNAHLFGVIFPTNNSYHLARVEAGLFFGQVVDDARRHIDLDASGAYEQGDFTLSLAIDGGLYPHSSGNARLVALSDNQLVFLLSLIRKTEFPEAWHMAWGDGVTSMPTYPSQPLNSWAYGRVVAWLEDLKEQLMVDVRPELQAMIAAQNEMSDDLDAIRIALEQIAADIEAENNSARLEEIANTIGLLVALL